MKITIIKDDKFIRIDDDRITDQSFDFSFLPSNFHALQWEGNKDGKTGLGEEEYAATATEPMKNVQITSIQKYLPLIEKARIAIEHRKMIIAADLASANIA